VPPILVSGRRHRQVGASVAIIVAGGNRLAQPVERFGLTEHAAPVLVPELVIVYADAAGRPVEYVQGPDLRLSRHAVPRRADGKIVAAVSVEVADDELAAKAVVSLGVIQDAVSIFSEKVVGSGA
jgi:hypothetical protein